MHLYPDPGSKFKNIEDKKIYEYIKPLNDNKKGIIIKCLDDNKLYKTTLDNLIRNFEDYHTPSNDISL